MDSISVIIPVYNEADSIGSLLRYLRKHDPERKIKEVIVVDGGSSDKTCLEARLGGAIVIPSAKPGRAVQMNVGAQFASGDILYFLHADSYPPLDFARTIFTAWQNGNGAGSFRMQFDTSHWLLDLYSWFTRWSFKPFRFGDQSLYVDRNLFLYINGFRDDHIVMEDNEIIGRINKYTTYCVLPGTVTTSARKYDENGIVRLQLIFICIYMMYHLGFSQNTLVRFYKHLVRNGKKPIPAT